MKDVLSLEDYKKRFQGFAVRDCAVAQRGMYFFVLLQDWHSDKPRPFEEELNTRLVRLQVGGDKPWVTSKLDGFGGLMCCGPKTPSTDCVCVDGGAQVFAKAPEGGEVEDGIPGGKEQGPARGGVRRLKQINGVLYGSGGIRSMFRRLGRNKWEEIGPLPPAGKGEVGFNDFDAFTESDIYAAGGKGDVWHCDGTAWRQVPFPSNMWIESVCCGQDGHVYIGAQSGNVFRGRGNEWKQIHKDTLSLPFKDMVWFGDRVYATSDHGLWEIKDGQVTKSSQPIEITNCSGNLSVGDGVMLLAGHSGAARHDGSGWTRLFGLIQLRNQMNEAG